MTICRASSNSSPGRDGSHLCRLALKAAKEGLSHEAYLYELVKEEVTLRRQRRVERLLRQSWLPREKTFRTLDLDRFPAALRLQIERLKSGAFLEQAINVVAVGKPGVGKSHLAAAVGYELVQLGQAVLWTSTATLMQRLLAAKRDLCLPQELTKLDRFTCVIFDDIGYVAQEREEMEVLFTFLDSDQHTTDQYHSQRQFIQVTAPHHPLQGQVFPLLRALTKQGESYVVIQLPSGATQQVPLRWTDQCPALPSPQALPPWSVTSVRELLDILKQLQDRACDQRR